MSHHWNQVTFSTLPSGRAVVEPVVVDDSEGKRHVTKPPQTQPQPPSPAATRRHSQDIFSYPMAPRISPFPSPVSPVIPLSDSSDDELASNIGDGGTGPSISRPGSPGSTAGGEPAFDAEDVAKCKWNDCGIIFHHLPTLIDHIHNDHIGNHRSNYTCEWTTCTRRGLPQTSRFALTSHIRSHTGEKPFTCPKPECDKSFTRSDALAKHMRLQHNLDPPLPGRGGSRKRKRNGKSPSPELLPGGAGTSTFKVEVNGDGNDDSNALGLPLGLGLHTSNGHGGDPDKLGLPGSVSAAHSGAGSDSEDDAGQMDPLFALPKHLQVLVDPVTEMIYKRTPAMVRYLVEKAKYRYAMEEHESLVEELATLRRALARETEMKEKAMDEVLLDEFGDEANELVTPVAPPPGYRVSQSGKVHGFYNSGDYDGSSRGNNGRSVED